MEKHLAPVRQYLQVDGGDIELVAFLPEGTLLVRLLGNCQTCPLQETTLQLGILENLKPFFPQIKKIQMV
ncbi:MAG: NifU family protein [Bacteroidia bacterium]